MSKIKQKRGPSIRGAVKRLTNIKLFELDSLTERDLKNLMSLNDLSMKAKTVWLERKNAKEAPNV